MTDADVDGSHIRTLLLTFFYRQMPELIERGHIYIAQPPLYKVKRGQEERYLKDDHELRPVSCCGRRSSGRRSMPREGAAPIAGDALAQLARAYLLAEAVIDRLARLIDAEALYACLRGRQARPRRRRAARERARSGCRRCSTPTAQDLRALRRQARAAPAGDQRNRHGNVRVSAIDDDFLVSGDYRQIVEAAEMVGGLVGRGRLRAAGRASGARSPTSARRCTGCCAEVERNAAVQRYKGLGEMNPGQLWETTMDPAARRLLKVQIEDAIAADEIFIKLMGDEVEPRRDFIEQHALVARIDV